ncbi:MAG: SUMF1/EgtB/PvdO family nonheme iron enzyme [Magnetococcales bacterium]|nr:SUMF1/EgtB/PvdO family nonheme iron enzyme [Magnetococcales bacterium]
MKKRIMIGTFPVMFLATAWSLAQAAAPTCANSISDQTWSGSGSKSFQFQATTFQDTDWDDLTYTAKRVDGLALPTWLNFDAATGTFSGNPPVGTSKYQLKVTANDGHNGTAVCAFALNLVNPNDAPALSTPIADQTWNPGSAQTFQLPATTFMDGDGDSLTYSATLADGAALPAWLTFAPATRTFSGTPPTGVASLNIKVTANDGHVGTAADTFALSFTSSANHAPTVASPIADRTWSGSGSKSFRVPIGTFTDADGDSLTYTVTRSDGSALPSWLRFAPTTRLFSGNPPSGAASLRLKVRASDGKGGTAADTFTLSFTNTNDAPTVATPIADQTWNGSFRVPASTFADGDGNALTYSARLADGSALPAWLSFSPSTRIFSGTAPSGVTGLGLRVTASDGRGGSGSETFHVAFPVINHAPVAAAGTLTVSRDAAATGTLRATDDDGDGLTYRVITNGSKGRVTLTDSATGAYRYTPNSGVTGTDTFTFRVNDGSVDSNLARITVTINAVAAEVTNSLGMTFKRIPAGTFVMGASDSDVSADSWLRYSIPRHQVTISSSFYMQATEVTQGQWQAVMGNNPSYYPGCGISCPVENVSWDNIQDFISRLNSRDEGTYRLPTEAEWEYAARAGSTTSYSFGSSVGSISEYAWWGCFSNGNSGCITHPVAQKLSNPWGLYDIHGNVWEWVSDWYGQFTTLSVVDPHGPITGLTRVFRGGSWGGSGPGNFSAIRDEETPDYHTDNLGFRLVMDPRTN